MTDRQLRFFILACVRDGRPEAISLAQQAYFRLATRMRRN